MPAPKARFDRFNRVPKYTSNIINKIETELNALLILSNANGGQNRAKNSIYI